MRATLERAAVSATLKLDNFSGYRKLFRLGLVLREIAGNHNAGKFHDTHFFSFFSGVAKVYLEHHQVLCKVENNSCNENANNIVLQTNLICKVVLVYIR